MVVRKAVNMARQMKNPILGVVENMSYLELPDGTRMEIFGKGGGEKMAAEAQATFLGAIPLYPAVRSGGDMGVPIVVAEPQSPVSIALKQIAVNTALQVGLVSLQSQADAVSISME